MKRREFITLIGGGAAAWPLAAGAQEGGRVRRIGVLLGGGEIGRPELAAFGQALQQLGWTDGRNLRIEYRSGLGNAADTRKLEAAALSVAMESIATSVHDAAEIERGIALFANV